MAAETDNKAPPMYQWACDLFPIHRSLTGQGVRETLHYLQQLLPTPMAIHGVPSGTKAFDWTVPKEWVCREAYVEDEAGNRIIDIRNSNLHVVQYSAPYTGWLTGQDLAPRIHVADGKPDAIPYVTSYYKERWGFCLSFAQRINLLRFDAKYYVHIDTELKDGHLTYGELIIHGKETSQVLLATNICHPSMANNELSGPVVVTALAQWLASKPRRHTYRIVFLPETIGALVYLSRHLEEMKYRTIAGYQVVCVGDHRRQVVSFLPSRNGNTLADRAALAALEPGDFVPWSFLERGSDERQWCAPGIDLPVASIMRSKYGTYPEYHTSLDDLSFISQKALERSLRLYQKTIEIIEANRTYKTTILGEPQLCKNGLYPEAVEEQLKILNVLAYADGTRDLIELAKTIECDVLEVGDIAEKLREHGLLETL